ncbi:MAG: hypothetical protein QF858_01870 [Candidatus Pacebacteria bacterium]|nr:hypothetical protein [Candidatus Paceibacterota bacterium]MDP6659542.1 hypothetical protein [Candidatus Paceibacterota bacterium]|tara:strand:+ start:6469 stop:6744 length:276 start_codon:yes stop_codon:yes gene_type:complete
MGIVFECHELDGEKSARNCAHCESGAMCKDEVVSIIAARKKVRLRRANRNGSKIIIMNIAFSVGACELHEMKVMEVAEAELKGQIKAMQKI